MGSPLESPKIRIAILLPALFPGALRRAHFVIDGLPQPVVAKVQLGAALGNIEGVDLAVDLSLHSYLGSIPCRIVVFEDGESRAARVGFLLVYFLI